MLVHLPTIIRFDGIGYEPCVHGANQTSPQTLRPIGGASSADKLSHPNRLSGAERATVASSRSRSTAERGGAEDGREKAPKTHRAERRLGAAGSALQVARAVGLRGDPPAHPIRKVRGGEGARNRCRGAHALPQAGALRGGGHGEPLRFGDGPPQTTARYEAAHPGPEG